MRDLLLVPIFLYLLVLILRRPYIGAGLWIWVSLFVPTSWVWGIASYLRMNLTVVIVSVIAYLLDKNKGRVFWTKTATFAIAFYLWFSLSAYFALTSTDAPFRWWDTFTRIIALFVFCQLVLTRKLHWDVFIWAMVLAIGGYGMLEATKYFVSGFSHQIVGISGGQHRDRNDLAVAMNTMIPLAVYLYTQTQHKGVRLGLIAMIALLAVAIIGTYSRGGLITLAALGLFYLISSGRKMIPVAILLGLAAFGISQVVTDQYTQRAQTIQTMGEDESFMGRVAAWKLSVYIALDRPLLGGGPFAVQTPDVWPMYEEIYDPDQWISTGPYSNATRAAHSLYFQVLGDTGFPGFFFYMAMLGTAMMLLWRTRKLAIQHSIDWLQSLSKALMLSFLCILIGASALSMAYFDLVFGMLALISAVGGHAMGRLNAPSPSAQAPALANTRRRPTITDNHQPPNPREPRPLRRPSP